jgi:arabinose-5-phosphate isomerase
MKAATATSPRPRPETGGALAAARADLASARRTLGLEAQGLTELSAALADDGPLAAAFVAALDAFAEVRGRIIVTGMGKSGHVARKIAATLASTGAPAQFVHPGEASHGDLGMVTREDAILALSNSGETAELGDLLNYAARFGLKLVAITSRTESTLAKAAHAALILPDVEEACPMRLAPTTSTTMQLALGDALAVALIERKGFTVQDFRLLHPGGRLGARLTKVSDLMHGGEALPTVKPDAAMSEALIEMTAKGFGCVAAVGPSGELLGIVTDGDLRRHMAPDLLRRKVRDVMTAQPRTIEAGALAAEAVRLMNEGAITSLMVREGERLAGIVRLHDCLRAGVA